MKNHNRVAEKPCHSSINEYKNNKMKHKIYIGLMAVCFLSFAVKAQVAIGKSAVEGTSTLLDFDDTDNTRGIILPAVTSLPASPANGTFVFDTTDNKVKVFYLGISDGAEGNWHYLTEVGIDPQPGSFDYPDTLTHLNNTADTGAGTVIGAESSTADGVLVLESTDKAMILPKIASPHMSVKSPYPGMMCYDTITHSLAVFDGSNWYFWR